MNTERCIREIAGADDDVSLRQCVIAVASRTGWSLAGLYRAVQRNSTTAQMAASLIRELREVRKGTGAADVTVDEVLAVLGDSTP